MPRSITTTIQPTAKSVLLSRKADAERKLADQLAASGNAPFRATLAYNRATVYARAAEKEAAKEAARGLN